MIQAGNGAEWIKVISSWEDNAQFAVSEIEVEDGSAQDNNAATGEISVDLAFTPLSAGTHSIRIWTAARDDLATSLDIVVTVTGESITTTETTPPPIDLVGTWWTLMIIVPIATAGILLVLGIIAFKGNE